MSEVMSAFVRFFARDEVSRGAREAEDSARRASRSMDELAQAAGERATKGLEKAGKAGKALKSALGGLAVGLAGSAFAGFIDSSQQTVENMAKLEGAFDAVGLSSNDAQAAYSDFVGLLGDEDQAVEAAQDMANLAQAGGDIPTWTKIAAGALSRFGDALPTENLIESANEAAKTGAVVGSLADALNWGTNDATVFSEALGVNETAQAAFSAAVAEGKNNEDAFNAALSACTTTSERQAIIQASLNALYGEAGQAYQDANRDLIAYRDSQADFAAKQGELAEALMPVQAAFYGIGSEIIGRLLPYAQQFAGWIGANMPMIQEGVGQAFDYISKEAMPPLVEAFTWLKDNVLPPVKDLFGWLIQNLPGLMPIIAGIAAAFVGFQVVTVIVNGITAAMKAWQTITMLVRTAQMMLHATMMANPFMLIVSLLAVLVGAFIAAYQTNEDFRAVVDRVFKAVGDVIGGFVDAVVGFFTVTIPNAGQSVMDFFGGIPGAIMGVFAGAGGWLTGIGQSIINGFLGGLKAAWGGVTSFIGGIGSWIVQHKGPESYDRVMLKPAGGWIMEGLNEGLQKRMPELRDRVAQVNEIIKTGVNARINPVVEAVRGADTVRSDAGRTYSPTINVKTGETDPSKLARMIETSQRRLAYDY